MAGRDGEEETAASQWPLVRCHHSGLWCDVFTTELNVEGEQTAGH